MLGARLVVAATPLLWQRSSQNLEKVSGLCTGICCPPCKRLSASKMQWLGQQAEAGVRDIRTNGRAFAAIKDRLTSGQQLVGAVF